MINGCIEKMADDPLMGVNRPVKSKPAPTTTQQQKEKSQASPQPFDANAFAASFSQPS
jgi:hypothetical protein